MNQREEMLHGETIRDQLLIEFRKLELQQQKTILLRVFQSCPDPLLQVCMLQLPAQQFGNELLSHWLDLGEQWCREECMTVPMVYAKVKELLEQ